MITCFIFHSLSCMSCMFNIFSPALGFESLDLNLVSSTWYFPFKNKPTRWAQKPVVSGGHYGPIHFHPGNLRILR